MVKRTVPVISGEKRTGSGNHDWVSSEGRVLWKRSHRLLLLFVAAVACMSVTGCWDRKEVNDLAIVTSAGLDRTENGDIELAVEIIASEQEKRGNQTSANLQQGGSSSTIVRFATGETMGDAVTKLQLMLPRTIYWGQLKVLVVGERLSRHGFREQLDYVVRDNEVRLRILPFICKGKVRDFFASPFSLEQSKADFLQGEAVRVFHKPLTLNAVIQNLGNVTEAVKVPYVNVPSKEKESNPYIQGYAAFSSDRMTGVLTGDMFSGLKWMINQINRDIETVKLKGTTPPHVSLAVISAQTRLLPRLEGGKWHMDVRIKTDLGVIQNTTRFKTSNPKNVKEMEKAVENHIRQKVERTIRHVQRMGTDVFGFGEAINRHSPEAWNKLQDHWKEEFAAIEVKVFIDANIRRIGMNIVPVGLPQEEEGK